MVPGVRPPAGGVCWRDAVPVARVAQRGGGGGERARGGAAAVLQAVAGAAAGQAAAAPPRGAADAATRVLPVEEPYAMGQEPAVDHAQDPGL
jgi:hypothetical protein